jgi:hypothetical protein
MQSVLKVYNFGRSYFAFLSFRPLHYAVIYVTIIISVGFLRGFSLFATASKLVHAVLLGTVFGIIQAMTLATTSVTLMTIIAVVVSLKLILSG